MTSAMTGPGAGIGMHTPTGASFARFRERQNALDHRSTVMMDVLNGRFEDE